MEFEDLKIFIAVTEEGSATRAAIRLAMTQPGVSQHIKKLENELGCELFDRVGRKLELNNFGKLLLGKAKKLCLEMESLQSLSTGEIKPVGMLRLGLTDSSTLTIVPTVLVEFRKRFPNVHIKIDVHESTEIEAGLLRDHYDFGIVTAAAKISPQLEEEILYYDRIDAIVCKKHPLADRKRISVEELTEWPILMFPRQSRTRHMIDDTFYKAGVSPKEVIDVYFNAAVVRLAEAGMGVALLSSKYITNEMAKHRCKHLRIIGDPFKRAISLARRRDAHMSEAAHAFYEMVKR